MNNENMHLGAFEPLLAGNTVFLRPFNELSLTGKEYQDAITIDNYVTFLFPTVVHELFHKYQSQCLTIPGYIILAIPIWRELTLEMYTDKVTDYAYDWIDKYSKNKFQEEFNNLHKKYYGENFDVESKSFIDRF
jgi:hypothetical protein